MGAERKKLEEIHQFEKMASAELLLMMNMHVFPTAEVGMIRKEIQLLRENCGDGDNHLVTTPLALEQEIRVADKKASLFRGRRLDEERIVSEHFSAAADGIQYNMDLEIAQQNQQAGLNRKSVRDSARF